MAYTKTPMQSTEQTKLIPIMAEFETRERSGAKDVDALNIIWEPVQNQLTGDNYFNALSRDGSSIILNNPPDNSGTIGLFFWDVTPGYLILVTPNNIYVYNAQTMALAATQFYASAGVGIVGGTEFLYQSGARSFFIYNGTALMEISSALVFTPCVDPDLPVQFGPKVTDVVSLDGYLFIAKADGTIANSDLNVPQSWSPSNFTKADAYGDPMVSLRRSGNYLVALGARSTQYYYNAGNPTGTPLAAMVGSTLSIGCIGAVSQKENALYFVGVSSAGAARVYKLENFKAQEVSTPAICRWLQTFTVIKNNNGQFMHGNMLLLNGHMVYVISQDQGTAPILTYGLDLETMLWSRFQFAGESNYITCAATGNRTDNSVDTKIRTVYGLRDANGMLQQFEPGFGTDSGGLFHSMFVTPQQDFGTYRIKFGSRLVLWTDKPPASANCVVSWTDDDYQTFSTPRVLDLYQARPALYALGSFNRRAFKIDYQGGYAMRWKFIELDYDQGTA